jgi:peptide-methionine (S)-S-oxide reductase
MRINVQHFGLPRLFHAAAVSIVVGSALAAGGVIAEPRLQSALFAGGCFWTMEHAFEAVPGVIKATSGYSGGRDPNPTYEAVSSERTGHLETVQVVFDPARISYAELLERYWRMIDPTDDGGQACDRGPSYHSAIFVANDDQKRIVAQSEAALLAGPLKGAHIATYVRPAGTFWPAESYHQHFADKTPASYCAYRIGCGRDRILRVVWAGR